ncbi:MAG: calcium-binding protein, partial [Phenylobacterium sp.]
TGADQLSGGAGADTFIFNGTADVGAGESVDGGADTDTLHLTATTDLSSVSITGIEALTLAEAADATFAGSQITGANWTVAGTTGGVVERVIVTAAANATVNLSGITTVTNAAFRIDGSTGDEVLTGTAGSDTITGGLGSDAMSGGGGDDTFVYNGTPDTSATETVNGGSGTDTVHLASNTNLSDVTFTDIEAFTIADGATLTLSPTQVGGQTWAVNGTSGGGTETLIVTSISGVALDLSTLTGLNHLAVTLNGAGGAETLTGTSVADTISGLVGADNLVGGAGADSLSGNDDADTLSGGIGGDTLSGGLGADILTGGADSDRFVFGTTDSGLTLGTADTIADFTSGADTLGLGLAGDATAGTGNYVEAGAAVADFTAALAAADLALAALNGTSAASQLYAFEFDGTNGYLFVDTDSDGDADQVIVLTGVDNTEISAGDIVT